MTNQEIVDLVDDVLPATLPCRDKILDGVFFVLNNELGMDLETDAGCKE